jgi:hypothetical protein
MSRMERTFSTEQVSEITGLSPRQLQWWDERKILVPQRSTGPRRRMYRETQALEACVLRELKRKGMSLLTIRHIWPKVKPVLFTDPDLALATNGRIVHVGHSTAILAWMVKARGAMMVVSISDQVNKVKQYQDRRLVRRVP